jgi:hypothetical protein
VGKKRKGVVDLLSFVGEEGGGGGGGGGGG